MQQLRAEAQVSVEDAVNDKREAPESYAAGNRERRQSDHRGQIQRVRVALEQRRHHRHEHHVPRDVKVGVEEMLLDAGPEESEARTGDETAVNQGARAERCVAEAWKAGQADAEPTGE